MNAELFNYLFGTDPGDIPENIILTPYFSSKHFKPYTEIISSFKGKLYSGFFCRKNSGSFAVIKCGLGAGLAGDCVLALQNTEASKIVFIGSAGGLSGARIGDIVIPGAAVNGEGFSVYYETGSDFARICREGTCVMPSSFLRQRIAEEIRQNLEGGGIIENGKIFTTGSILCETEKNLTELERSGFIAFEMDSMENGSIIRAASPATSGIEVIFEVITGVSA